MKYYIYNPKYNKFWRNDFSGSQWTCDLEEARVFLIYRHASISAGYLERVVDENEAQILSVMNS